MRSVIIKYLEGHASAAEQMELLSWLRIKTNRKAFKDVKHEWKINRDVGSFSVEGERSWITIQDQLMQKNYRSLEAARKSSLVFKIAAIFFFVISLGGSIYLFSKRHEVVPEFYTTVVAENGQVSKVNLPDGSEVWLNSGTEISYNNMFAAQNRNVKLTGEAYFNVVENQTIPFVVNSDDFLIKVLGTKFNVSAYPKSSKIEVVLESGSVKSLLESSESFQHNLKPEERAIFNKTSRVLNVSEVNTTKYTSWKDGMIHIYDQTLVELVKRLEARYNQKFSYGEEIKNYHFTFTIKNESLDEIISLMEMIAPIIAVQNGDLIEFKIDNKRKREVGVN